MPLLQSFDPSVDRVPSWPIRALDSIAYRARQVVDSMTIGELQRCASTVQAAIKETKAREWDARMLARAQELVDRGGWELAYYPAGSPITVAGVLFLLNNWPNDAEEEPDVLADGEIPDVEALSIAIADDRIPQQFLITPTSYGDTIFDESRSTASLFALLALMKVEAALESLGWTADRRWVDTRTEGRYWLLTAADSALEASAALGMAEVANLEARHRALALVDKPGTSTVRPLPAALLSPRGNDSRRQVYAEIREFVKGQAEAARRGGSFNEDIFAAAMVTEIALRYRRRAHGRNGQRPGDPITVTAATVKNYLR